MKYMVDNPSSFGINYWPTVATLQATYTTSFQWFERQRPVTQSHVDKLNLKIHNTIWKENYETVKSALNDI